MIPVKSNMTQVDELPAIAEREFSIGDPRWVMKTQADLYSNRELAVAREYSTNAYDANAERAAREGRDPSPIEVTLPSMMNPFFTVKDKGDGMTMDIMLDIYTSFGVSTKRGSKVSNGLLGYGCKSAAAYTKTFTVTSVHSGIKTEAVVTRRPDWSIVMKVISQVKTNEETGTEVKVPVSDWQKFRHIAEDFYRFWLPGRVLVDGAEPKHNVGEKVTDGLYFSTHWNTSYVVMSNVPYRINNPEVMFRNSKMSRINFVAYVDTVVDGEGNEVAAVEFTPSREDLKYTDHTISTLQQVISNFEKQIVTAAEADIANAKTHAEAFKAWKKWTDTLGTRMFEHLTFKGVKFENTFVFFGTRYDENAYPTTRSIRDWHVDQMERTMVVTECDVNVSSSVKARANAYAAQVGWPHKFILFTSRKKSDINSIWIDKTHFVTWEDLKAALPKTVKVPGQRRARVKGTYDYRNFDFVVREQEVPKDGDVFWISLQEYKRRWSSIYKRTVKAIGKPHAVTIILPENRINKFCRENPTVKNLGEFARSKVVVDCETLLSDDAKAALSVPSDTLHWMNLLDLGRVDDPMFAEAKRLAENKDKLMEPYEQNLVLASLFNMRYTVKEHSIGKTGPSAAERYPLLGVLRHSSAPVDDLYLYLNAAYAAKYAKKK